MLPQSLVIFSIVERKKIFEFICCFYSEFVTFMSSVPTSKAEAISCRNRYTTAVSEDNRSALLTMFVIILGASFTTPSHPRFYLYCHIFFFQIQPTTMIVLHYMLHYKKMPCLRRIFHSYCKHYALVFSSFWKWIWNQSSSVRDGLLSKEMLFFGLCPNEGGRASAQFFGTFSKSAFWVNYMSLYPQKCQ